MNSNGYPVSVVIPYHKNIDGLSLLLATLQAQTIPPDRIVIIDTSENKSGLSIARRYNTNTGVKVIVEYAKVGIYDAWNRGIDHSDGMHTIILNDDVLVPMNFVDIMYVTAHKFNPYIVVPNTPPRDHFQRRVDMKFDWYSPIPEQKDILKTAWMPGFAFMLTPKALKEIGKFNLDYKVWFGDDDMQERAHAKANEAGTTSIIKINSLFVYHYGGMSYDYEKRNPKLFAQIQRDRELFHKLHPTEKYEKLLHKGSN